MADGISLEDHGDWESIETTPLIEVNENNEYATSMTKNADADATIPTSSSENHPRITETNNNNNNDNDNEKTDQDQPIPRSKTKTDQNQSENRIPPRLTTNLQTLAKLSLLAQLPTQLIIGIALATFHQRHRVFDPTATEEILESAGDQLRLVLERSRRSFEWIDMEMPGWMETKFDPLYSLREINPPFTSSSSDSSSSSQEQHQSHPSQTNNHEKQQRRQRHRRGRQKQREHHSGLLKFILIVFSLMFLQSLFTLPFALLRWSITPKIPVWIVLAAVMMRVKHCRQRHRRRRQQQRREFLDSLGGGFGWGRVRGEESSDYSDGDYSSDDDDRERQRRWKEKGKAE